MDPFGKIFRQVSCFSDRRWSNPARLRTTRKSLYVNEAMLDLDQRAHLPISLASGYGFNIGYMVGSVWTGRVSITVLEILLRVVSNRIDQVFQCCIDGRKFRHKIQLWTLGAIVATILCKKNRQKRFSNHDLGFFPSTTGHP